MALVVFANISGNIVEFHGSTSSYEVDLNTIILGSIAVGALAASIVFGWQQKRHGIFQRLIEVYNMINTVDQREARKNIYKAYRAYYARYFDDWDGDIDHDWKTYTSKNIRVGKEYADIFADDAVLEELKIDKEEMFKQVEMVRATFDHIGALLKHKLVPRQPLLNSLWGTGRVCWICLRDNIMIERDKRETEYYMDYFAYLFLQIEDYIDDNNLRHVTPYREDDNTLL